MWGGPSQLETYDMKPNAPREYRGPFNPIQSTIGGMDVVEHFPMQAKIADKFSVIRTLHHEMSAHNDGSIEVLTGKTPDKPDPTSQARSKHPDFGMVASRVRGPRPDGLPQYFGVHRSPFMTKPTYPGLSHQAFHTGDPTKKNYAPQNLTLAAGVDGKRLDDRRSLVNQFDRFRRHLDLSGSMKGVDDFRVAAFDMLTSARFGRAFDLGREPDSVRDRYGRHRWGQNCLLARRLAESGAAVINVDATAPSDKSTNFSWDDHAGPFHLVHANLERFPLYDQAITALIEDIHQRGLDKKIMVVACGEFGRTPRLTHRATFPNKKGGPWLGRTTGPTRSGTDRRGWAANGRRCRTDQLPGRTPAERSGHSPGPAGDDLSAPGKDPQIGLEDHSGPPIPNFLQRPTHPAVSVSEKMWDPGSRPLYTASTHSAQ
ncbi:MAG: hypothetical protein CM1200mP2_17130 [Planctomycetaceae bacterium]|nr:MAG: hypothetical protein CM1200mP2_17130 [Planctomycetaceae bacterium]